MPFGTYILNDGNEIPTIAYGTGSKWKGQDVTKYVEQAIDTGFNHIDTASFYGNETSVGAAIKESGLERSDLYITTKYSVGPIRPNLIISLHKLGLKQVDLWLVHSPRLIEPNFEGNWKEFERAQADGLTKSIGVSNFTVPDLERLLKTAKVKPAVNQIKFHPYNYTENKPILEYCAKHNIIVESYSGLAPITTYPGGPVDVPLAAAAKLRNATPTQINLLWIQSKGVVIVTTSSSKEHLQEYLAVADLPPLTAEEIADIEEAGSKGPPSSSRMAAAIRKLGKRNAYVLLGVSVTYLLLQSLYRVFGDGGSYQGW